MDGKFPITLTENISITCFGSGSDSGTMRRISLLYVTFSVVALLSLTSYTVICFVLKVFTGIPLHSSNSWITSMRSSMPVLFCAKQDMSSENRMSLKGSMFGRPWWMLLFLSISVKYRDRAFIKREKRRGDRTLPWSTPVLKVILTLPMSVWGIGTVVCSYRDFRRSISGILYDCRIAHREDWSMELKTLLKSISTRRKCFFRR